MKKRPVIGMMLGNINVDFTVELAHGIYKYAHENNADTVVLMSAPVSNLLGVNNIEDIFYIEDDKILEYIKEFKENTFKCN